MNLRFLQSSYDISLLKKFYAGKPAVIAAAGPSLDNNLKYLDSVKNNCIIFSVDTALSALLKYSISPDFVCSVDSQYINYLLIKGLHKNNISLISTLIANPNTLEEFKDSPMFFFNTKSAVDNYFYKNGVPLTFAKSGGSVATSLFSVCRELGCNPIIFIGQDLSFSSSKSHSIVTRKLENNINKINKFSTYETNFFYENIDMIYQKDILDKPVLTSPNLLNFCRWFEIECADKKARYINATGAGIFKNNVEIIDFKDVCNNILTNNLKKIKFNESAENKIINPKLLKKIVKQMSMELNYLYEFSDNIEMLKKITASSLNEIISMPAQYELLEYEMHGKNLQRTACKLREVIWKCRNILLTFS